MPIYTVLQSKPYPIYEINLQHLNAAAEISWIMSEVNAVYYVYTFEFNGNVIKHGLSVDVKSNFGDRIYRQAGHLEGWDTQLHGPNGNDMRLIDAEYYAKTGVHLNRNGMKIVVHDLTRTPSPHPTDPVYHVKQLERQLIRDHQEKYNILPVGNIKDEAHIDRKTHVDQTVLNNLFSFE